MKYENPNLLELLAREYVLGTLAGPARRRFERVLEQSPHARQLVTEWEERLLPLSLSLHPVAPHPRVWQSLARRLRLAPPPARRGRLWQRVGPWQAAAASLAVLALALAAVLTTRPPTAIEPAYLAVVSDDQNRPLWLVRVHEDTRELSVRVINRPPAEPDQAYELWMLPEGEPPVSLGLLPDQGIATAAITATALAALARSKALAVSLEPAGGSPTGQPTGPVLFVAALVPS